jgi:hypothetical protein
MEFFNVRGLERAALEIHRILKEFYSRLFAFN